MPSRDRRLQLGLIAVIVVAVGVAAWQSGRIDRMRRVEQFYRWVLSASTQVSFGDSLESEKVEGEPEPMDDELFTEVMNLADRQLSQTIPVEDDDLTADGQPKPKLLRAIRQGRDMAVYRMLEGAGARPLLNEFQQHLQDGRLVSAGTQFSAASLYGDPAQSAGVGLTSLFFGFRKLAANFIWLQVDKFWHEGQMHRMVPLMRTTVTLDPTFVDAYLLGAWHLAYNLTAKLPETPEPLKEWNPKYKKRLGRKEQWYYVAADFLKDGIRKNPRDFRLYFDLGYAIYENKLNDHENAVRYLTEARRYPHKQWVPRMLYLAMWRNGQYEDAIDGWLEYLKEFPDSHQAQRFLQINRAYLHGAKWEQATQCAKTAGNVASDFALKAARADANGEEAKAAEFTEQADKAKRVAQEMEDFAAEQWEQAKTIWLAMIQQSGDSIAKARMYRHTALDYANEDRYLEAVSELDLARYEMLESFDELSNLMIEIKLEGSLPLTVSEKLAVERKREAVSYGAETKTKTRRYVDCPYEIPEKEPLWLTADIEGLD